MRDFHTRDPFFNFTTTFNGALTGIAIENNFSVTNTSKVTSAINSGCLFYLRIEPVRLHAKALRRYDRRRHGRHRQY